jgi:hypothetical protein
MAEIRDFYFKTREEFRNWFIKNHELESSFDMLFYKRHTKKQYIEYNDDEAMFY